MYMYSRILSEPSSNFLRMPFGEKKEKEFVFYYSIQMFYITLYLSFSDNAYIKSDFINKIK